MFPTPSTALNLFRPLAFVAGAIACLWATPAQAQFVHGFGTTGQEYGKCAAVDSADHVIVGALFMGTVDADPGPGVATLTSNGGVDTALIKYDRFGNLVWARAIGAPNSTDVPHGVSVDATGNIYMTGYFGQDDGPQRTVDFDPGAGTVNLTSQSGFDAFLAKYDPNGNCLWARGFGNTTTNTEERAWDIAVEPATGAVFFTGAFAGSVDFNPGGTPRVVSAVTATHDLFVAKYDTNGTNLWAVGIGSGFVNVFTEGYGTVDVDGAGGCYLSGNFRGTGVDFNPGAGSNTLSSAGNTDIFLGHYTSTGAYDYAVRLGGPGSDIVSPGAMRRGSDGNLFLTGRFSGTSDFDPGAGTVNLTPPAGSNTFIASYSPTGQYRWAINLAANSGSHGGHRVGTDAAGNLLVAGWFSGTTDFDGTAGTSNLIAHGTFADAFVAKYNSGTGSLVWARGFGSADGTDNNIAAGLAIDSAGNSIITGQVFGTNADFDPSPTGQALLSSAGQNDYFVAKYTPAGDVYSAPAAGVDLWEKY